MIPKHACVYAHSLLLHRSHFFARFRTGAVPCCADRGLLVKDDGRDPRDEGRRRPADAVSCGSLLSPVNRCRCCCESTSVSTFRSIVPSGCRTTVSRTVWRWPFTIRVVVDVDVEVPPKPPEVDDEDMLKEEVVVFPFMFIPPPFIIMAKGSPPKPPNVLCSCCWCRIPIG